MYFFARGAWKPSCWRDYGCRKRNRIRRVPEIRLRRIPDPEAEKRQSAYEYVAEENRAAAVRSADQIWESSQLLARHPMAGRVGRVADTRELVISGTPFLVAYRIEKNEVRILAVLHAAREWPEEFG